MQQVTWRRTLRRRVAGGCAMLVVASLVPLLGCGGSGSGTAPCTSGTPLAALSQANVSAALRAAIRDPGPIIGRWLDGAHTVPNPEFPSGKVVVVPFETPDFPRNPAITPSTLTSTFFATGQLSGPSIAHYFLENSYGAFDVTNGGVVNWVTLTKALGAYEGFEGDAALPSDVLAQANVNWAALDTNHDDVITPAEAQIVFVVSNGYSAATRGFVSYAGPAPVGVPQITVATPTGTFAFRPPVVYIGTKTASDPTASVNAIRIFSSIAHELAHAFFNLPDRYVGPCGSGLAGSYDLMSDNCQWHHLNPHDKIKIGWLDPVIHLGHAGSCVAFPASESSPSALVLPHPNAADPAQEYWIVENRHRLSSGCGGCTFLLPPLDVTGVFDAGNPESGLAVWWVRRGTWSQGHDEVRLVDASRPDSDPDGTTPVQGPDPGYLGQGVGALFVRDDADPKKLLLDSSGTWSLLFFTSVSQAGSTMYAEF